MARGRHLAPAHGLRQASCDWLVTNVQTFACWGHRACAATLLSCMLCMRPALLHALYAAVAIKHVRLRHVPEAEEPSLPQASSCACLYLMQNPLLMLLMPAGFALKRKYKGASNRNTQIRSTFSPSGSHLICGSDDGWVYVWATNNKRVRSRMLMSQAQIACCSPVKCAGSICGLLAWQRVLVPCAEHDAQSRSSQCCTVSVSHWLPLLQASSAVC